VVMLRLAIERCAILQGVSQNCENGDYRWVAQVVNHVVFADPSNKAPPSPLLVTG
jgi:alkyl sulfatase BDS1-like metallo-beta-lactamase superfamily hydrolase